MRCLTCIASYSQVTEGLTKDLQELAADRRQLQRDLDIKTEVEQQMAVRGALQVGALAARSHLLPSSSTAYDLAFAQAQVGCEWLCRLGA